MPVVQLARGILASRGEPGDQAVGRDPLHGVIQVIEISWDPNDPLDGVTAKEIAEPRLTYPADPDNRFV